MHPAKIGKLKNKGKENTRRRPHKTHYYTVQSHVVCMSLWYKEEVNREERKGKHQKKKEEKRKDNYQEQKMFRQ